MGSLGVPRYLALVEGAGPPDGYQLLDIKECRAIRGAPCATDTLAGSEGEEARRVVVSQTILLGHVAAGLDVLKIGQRSYRMRKMIPVENRSSLDRFQGPPERTAAGRRTSRPVDRFVPTSRAQFQARSRSLARSGSMGRGPLPRRRPRRPRPASPSAPNGNTRSFKPPLTTPEASRPLCTLSAGPATQVEAT